MKSRRWIQEKAIEAVLNHNMVGAHILVTHGCKTKPEEMAYRVGRIACALLDPKGFHRRPDLAEQFINLFKDGPDEHKQ